MVPPAESRRTSYRFGLFEVDSRTGELRKQGRQIKLRGRPFDILVLLLAGRGDVITREELQRQLWPADTFVDFDHGLNSAMNRLREALGDSAENPRFIETLPRRGYRFIAPVSVIDARQPLTDSSSLAALPAPPPPPDIVPTRDAGSRDPTYVPPIESAHLPPVTVVGQVSRSAVPMRLIATGSLVVAVIVAMLYLLVVRISPPASSRMTLAVLPFENLSNDADQEYFSDGFTEEMIAELGKLDPDHLGVIARTTTMLYKGARKSVGQITRELGVNYVLEGSIRRAGNRIRITAQLVQTRDMTHLWAETYDRDVSDVLGIQSEVAMKIARSLTLALRPRDNANDTTPESSPAYELVLRGRFFRDQATEESARKAIEYFQQAIALDPGYVPAHAGLADAYWLLGAPGWEVDRPAGLLQQAMTHAERALAIHPQSAEAHAVSAMIRLHYQWDPAGAEREIQEAIRLNSNFGQAHQYYATVLLAMRRFDEAIQEAQRAMDLDPLSAPAGATLGVSYYYAGRDTEAIAQFTKTLEISPEFGIAHLGLARCYRRRDDTSRELKELRRAVELSDRSAYMRAHLAYGLARAEDRDGARALQQELETEGKERYTSPYHLALVAAGLADRDAVVGWLERTYADRSGWMMFLRVEPEFDELRQQPEIQRLLERVRPLS